MYNHPRNSSTQIICHYCGFPSHKTPDYRKKKQDHGGTSSKMHLNSFTNEGPLYLSSTNLANFDQATSWYLDSKASQHMSPLKLLFRDYKELSSPRLIIFRR